jgi:uncharacterized protein
MKNKTLVGLAASTLKKREGERLTARMLAEAIMLDNPEWVATKRDKSKNPAIKNGGASEMELQVQAEIGSNKSAIERHTNLRMTEDRPRRYYYTSLSEAEEVEAVEAENTSHSPSKYSEHDLYPILAQYLATDHRVYSKRIDEKRSKNSFGPRGNQWLHPDLIGFETLSNDWSDTVRQLVKARSDPETRLWSFEVKKLINRSNVREVYFQALSNSAWANLGYLVAAEISGKGTIEELRLLSAQHGIGVIQLATAEASESLILIQAELRSSVDWTAASRLCGENTDAEKVFDQVRIYHQSGSVNEQFWDEEL